MDKRFLTHYDRELSHIRESAADFARQFPKIAGRLGLEGFECADPYVERLLEGFAYLSARVQVKLDAEFPRFTQGLLETVYPHYLAPTPSTCIVRFDPTPGDGSLAEGFDLPQGRVLRSAIGKGEQTACEYRTAHDVTLLPIKVAKAEYFTRGLAAVHAPDQAVREGAKAAIRLRLSTTGNQPFSEVALDKLVIYLHGADKKPARLLEQILGHTIGFIAQSPESPPSFQETIGAAHVRPVGFDDEQALLPYDSRSFHGYRLVQEYFVLPQRFLFVELGGLAAAAKKCTGTTLDLVLLLDEVDLELENAFDHQNFQLFCTPAVNLFPKRCDRIHLSDKAHEFHVVPDRTRPLDFEVHSVLAVEGYGESAEDQQVFTPFYSSTDLDADRRRAGAYFTVNRLPRTLSAKEVQRGPRSSYAGGEAYVSLVDASSAPYASTLRQLGIQALCTNRDLPLRMPVGRGMTDFTMEEGGPVDAVRCLAGPTKPMSSFAQGEMAWRVISHLTLNYLSLVDGGGKGIAALRDLLRLYSDQGEAHIRKQIEGLRSVSSRAITRRVETPGPVAFARGLEITVTMEESAFEGVGVFVLGAVLEQFFARYVSINSFTETVIRTDERGEVMRWPARMGIRQIA